MSIIFQSFRLMQRQFATHLKRPILRRFPPPTTTINKSINQQGALSSLPRSLLPRIGGGRWSIIPKPSIRPSVFLNAPILSSTIQNISLFSKPVSGHQPTTEPAYFQPFPLPESKVRDHEDDDLHDRISRWSADVVRALRPQDSLITEEVQLTDQVIHDLVAHRFVFPILTPDDS